MAGPILQLRGVSKAFGGVRALVDGALDLHPGQVTALIGENGAGKSTLVKIMTGVYPPDAGEILLEGRPVRIASSAAAQRLGISVIHQEPVIFDDLSVAENIFIVDPLRRWGFLDWTAMRRRARALLQALEVDIDPALPAGRLSVGHKHLVQIARALAQDAKIVIMDEPTASLSHREAEDLFAIVRRLRDEGRAVLFISHRFEEVFALCDRYEVFRDGAFIARGLIAEATAPGLIAAMVGRPLDQIYPVRERAAGREALRVEGLGRAREYDDVSFSVAAGEVLAVYGLVGAGRSEVMQTLFGLNTADRGRVLLDGEAYGAKSPGEAIRRGLAYVPEDRQTQGAFLSLPIRENIALPVLDRLSRWGWLSASAERAETGELATRFRIKASGLDQPVGELSGGNQQKVVLAKWVATRPRVLILDEPTKGVDVGSKAAVHQAVAALAKDGVAVIMVSSELPEVLGMADRVAVMRRGRLRGILGRDAATPDAVMRLATGD